jgi:hypothetical protein
LFSSTGAKLSLTPIVDDMFDNLLDIEDDANELETCACCDCLTHEQDMLDWQGYRVCEQCYCDFVSPNSLP